jgi:hypothetical protein
MSLVGASMCGLEGLLSCGGGVGSCNGMSMADSTLLAALKSEDWFNPCAVVMRDSSGGQVAREVVLSCSTGETIASSGVGMVRWRAKRRSRWTRYLITHETKRRRRSDQRIGQSKSVSVAMGVVCHGGCWCWHRRCLGRRSGSAEGCHSSRLRVRGEGCASLTWAGQDAKARLHIETWLRHRFGMLRGLERTTACSAQRAWNCFFISGNFKHICMVAWLMHRNLARTERYIGIKHGLACHRAWRYTQVCVEIYLVLI